MNHDHHGHDHSAHDHGSSSNNNNPQQPPSIATTVAQAIQAVVENTTRTIINATSKPTIEADIHAHHNHGNEAEDHSAHQHGKVIGLPYTLIISAGSSKHSFGSLSIFVFNLFCVLDHSSAASSPDHSSHAGHVMKMWFHGGTQEVILFDFWRIESGFGLFISFLLIFALGAIYEGLKWFRIYLQMKETKRIQKQRRILSPSTAAVTMNQLEESVNKRLSGAPHQPNEALLPSSGLNGDQVYVSTVKEADEDDDAADVGFFKWSTKKSSPLDKSRIIQAALYCVQITIAYFLMLIAMTYNIWLTAAVVLGAGFGHWLFSTGYPDSTSSNAETTDAVTSDACH